MASGLRNIERWEIISAKEKKQSEEAKRALTNESKDQSILSSKSGLNKWTCYTRRILLKSLKPVLTF